MSLYIAVVFILLILCFCRGGDISQLKLSTTLNATAESEIGWSMETVYHDQNLFEKKIYSYQLEGDDSCVIYDPSLFTEDVFHLGIGAVVYDFAIAKDSLYFVTKSFVGRLNLTDIMTENATSFTQIYQISQQRFRYIDTFTFPDGLTLIILKSFEPHFSYMILPPGAVEASAPQAFVEKTEGFTPDMKIEVWDKYIFIPARNNGIFIYKYSSATSLELVKQLTEIKDARDIAIKYSTEYNYLTLIVAAGIQGILILKLDPSTMTITNTQIMKEFANVKSVSIVSEKNVTRLLVLLETLKSTTQFYILTLSMEDGIKFVYDDIKLLDGVAQYGDANAKYASVLMGNSVIVSETTRKNDNMLIYIDSEEVSHAKLFDTKNLAGVWIFYTYKRAIQAKRVMSHTGFFLCNIQRQNFYNFVISGLSHECGVDSSGNHITNCLHQVNVTINVGSLTHSSLYKRTKYFGLLVGAVIFILVLFLCGLLLVTYLCYRITLRNLSAMQRLGSLGNAPQEVSRGDSGLNLVSDGSRIAQKQAPSEELRISVAMGSSTRV